ncbi:dihydrofolate reductase [Arthrobacter roseus]
MIWAQTESGVIGKNGSMPWHLPADMAHFKRTTTGHPVIMGRRTWDSFPAKFRPLPDRTNIVVTRKKELAAEIAEAGAVVVGSLEEALDAASQAPGSEEIWIAGGGQLYLEAEPMAQFAVVTVIEAEVEGDTYAPKLGPDWQLRSVAPGSGWDTDSNGTRYRISAWEHPV